MGLNHPLICDLPDDSKKSELYLLLPKIAILVGVDSKPEQADLMVLVTGIIRNYAAFTVEEIYLAFEMNMIQTNDKVQHFNRFNFDYFTNIMSAYRKRKQTAWIEYVKLKNDKSLTDQSKKATDEEVYKGVLTQYQIDGELPQFANWWAVFDYLWKSGQCHTKEEMSAYFASKSEIIKAKIQGKIMTTFNPIEKEALKLLLKPDAIRSEVREMYCRKRIVELHPVTESLTSDQL